MLLLGTGGEVSEEILYLHSPPHTPYNINGDANHRQVPTRTEAERNLREKKCFPGL